MQIEITPLQASDLEQATRIFKLAFGTFLGLPDPAAAFGDRDFLGPRWRNGSGVVLAAHADGRLIGSNGITRWGSFGFFGPLTVLPEFWNQGVAGKLLQETVGVFESWNVRHSGLFTFPQSTMHVGLYQKFGYWPQYLTAVMTKTPEVRDNSGVLFSSLNEPARAETLRAARELTDGVSAGLDVSEEIRACHQYRTGETVLIPGDQGVDGFAVCCMGAGTEGGSGLCYVRFAAARDGESFDHLLDACETLAAGRGLKLEAGVNLAREDAFRRMRARGYRTAAQGVAMQRPHHAGFNRGDVYVMDDWR